VGGEDLSEKRPGISDTFDPVAELRALEREFGKGRADLERRARAAELEKVRALERRIAELDRPLTVLPIGDSHSHPEVPNDRYRWAGRMAADLGADVVVDMGDWNDVDSLNHYDKGKRCFEGRRLWKDMDAAIEAQEFFRDGLSGHQPILVRCLGNHEHRLARVAELEPEYGDKITIKDMKSEEYGWNVVPFLEPVQVAGTFFVHYLEKRGSSRAISGVVSARNTLLAAHRSIVVGHSHVRSYYEEAAIDGKRLISLNAACFFENHMAYAGRDNNLFGRGLHVLRNMQDGEFETEWVEMTSIERRYGG
jgi:hypothetical protein